MVTLLHCLTSKHTHTRVSSEHTTKAIKATAMPHAILNPAMHLSQYIPWKAMVWYFEKWGKENHRNTI